MPMIAYTPEERLAAVYRQISAHKVRVEFKQDSCFWKTLNVLLMVVTFGRFRTFSTHYATAIGTRIGVPEDWVHKSSSQKYEILLHELQHIQQYRTAGFGSLWLGTVFVGIGYLLLPLPIGLAWCRAACEKAAYRESIRAIVQCHGRSTAEIYKDVIVQQFTGVNYLYMWPFKQHMERWFDETLDRVCFEEGV